MGSGQQRCNYEVSRARIEQLNEQIETLEIAVARARTMDAHRADQLGHLHEVEREQYARLKDRTAYLTLMNSWLIILLGTRHRTTK